MLQLQHQVSDQSKIPPVDLVKDLASPRETLQENLERSERPQVASPLTSLQSSLTPTFMGQMANSVALVAFGSTWVILMVIVTFSAQWL
ncbi:hypothetical protein Tco_0726402 [Tanacetum coccineum]|uniref:Uncharacterized protein n=1 Tax=Tanacetum coccineum TaxID=301880 RepID=A0ABQ4YGD9_9ASTR